MRASREKARLAPVADGSGILFFLLGIAAEGFLWFGV